MGGCLVAFLAWVVGGAVWVGLVGWSGTGGRPFAIFLLVCLVAVFALDTWSDGAR